MSPHPEPATPTSRAIDRSALHIGAPTFFVVTSSIDGLVNLAASSTHLVRAQHLMIGLKNDGRSLANLRELPELTVSFPSEELRPISTQLERNACRGSASGVTEDVDAAAPRSFLSAGLTAELSASVIPPRVHECPLQFEACVRRVVPSSSIDNTLPDDMSIIHARIARVHAAPSLVSDCANRTAPENWHPLIYALQHAFRREGLADQTRMSGDPAEPVEISRWESFGGTWRVVATSEDHATIELRRCDGGELVDTLHWSAPGLLQWARRQPYR